MEDEMPIEIPVTRTVKGPAGNEEVTTHPAFGLIRASRVQGRAILSGSDFDHLNFMTITIFRSRRHRSLHQDWDFATEVVTEVNLSEAQWATFVSAPNVGQGVPCTLTYIDGTQIPSLPLPESHADKFVGEMEARLKAIVNGTKAALTLLDEMPASASRKKDLRLKLEALLRDLDKNLPFVATQFGEHVEEVIEKAKTEVHGYVTGVVQRAGLTALQQGDGPIRFLEDDNKEG
jgi:hypothetical protein